MHMHPVTVFLEHSDGEDMPFQPPVECPICRETLALDRTLEEHLVGSHTPLEVARQLAARHESGGLRRVSE
ncbi:hypothetical protein BDK88_0138 [Natrinema hispanicum]|uniref:C2H2-type domain-containing protein n=2 Tax=Natrinema hispanicum TaxID=392421 RepID=A0A482Y9V1_9EURY|nr:hypothetical protein BDK88_0138 [Natrinema hispanicum]